MAASHGTSNSDTAKLESDAVAQFKAGKYAKAAEEFEEAAEQHDEKAEAQLKAKDFKGAAREYQAAADDIGNEFESNLHNNAKPQRIGELLTLVDLQQNEHDKATDALSAKKDEKVDAGAIAAKQKAIVAAMAHEKNGDFVAVVEDLFARNEAQYKDTNHPPDAKTLAELNELANMELDRAEKAAADAKALQVRAAVQPLPANPSAAGMYRAPAVRPAPPRAPDVQDKPCWCNIM